MKLMLLLFSFNCNQLKEITQNVEKHKTLTITQKIEIIQELQKVKSSCPLAMNLNE